MSIFLILIFIEHPQINNKISTEYTALYFVICDGIINLMKKNKKDNYTKGFGILIFFWIYSLLEYIMQVGVYGFSLNYFII